jgi:hypothetical protein
MILPSKINVIGSFIKSNKKEQANEQPADVCEEVNKECDSQEELLQACVNNKGAKKRCNQHAAFVERIKKNDTEKSNTLPNARI